MRLALVNLKGGVGKTTTAVNLAAAFARSGLRSLVVDLDPQGSASLSFGVARDEEAGPSAAEVLTGKAEAAEAIRPTGTEGIDLLPASLRLAGLDLALARKHEPETLLKRALSPLRRRYDTILIDCPPGLTILSMNGLAAATAYLVPVVPHHLDMEALAGFLEVMDGARERLGKLPERLGILLTMVDHRTMVTDEVAQAIRKKYGQQVLKTEIPVNVRLAQAPALGRTIFDFESWSTGAYAYGRLGGEVLRRARKAGLL
jgi:chromosome partitioning protein